MKPKGETLVNHKTIIQSLPLAIGRFIIFIIILALALPAMGEELTFSSKPTISGIMASVKKTADKDPKTILDKVIEKDGGRDKLKALKTIYVRTEITGVQPMETDTYIEYPNKFRVDYYIQGKQVQSIVLDGEKAYVLVQGQVKELDPPITKELAVAIHADLIIENVADERVKVDMKYLGEIDLSGFTMDVIELTSENTPNVILFIDQKTFIKVMSCYSWAQKEIITINSDHRVVDGILVAHKSMVYSGSTQTPAVIKEIKLNPELKPDLFQPKP